MGEKVFQTQLTDAEIEENFKNVDFLSGLMSGLEEALAYEKGNAKAKTIVRKRSLPDVNISGTRKRLQMSQKAFASVLGVSPRTVEAWESDKSTPTPTAKKLIYLIDSDPTLIQKLQA